MSPTEALVRRQWEATIEWLRIEDAESRAALPSGLDGWTVGDLIAHLGVGLGTLIELRPAQGTDAPLSLAQYLRAYAPAAADIAQASRIEAVRLSPTLIGGLERIADQAWSALERNDDRVVVGRRGPLHRDDYLLTRLIELVVHSDDLARALEPTSSDPVIPKALEAVSDALRRAYLEYGGAAHEVTHGWQWVRLAAGRTPSDDELLPVL